MYPHGMTKRGAGSGGRGLSVYVFPFDSFLISVFEFWTVHNENGLVISSSPFRCTAMTRVSNLMLLISLLLLILKGRRALCINTQHTFLIANDTFLKDGKPFRILGGEIHYFRVPAMYWEDRLLRAKSLGLNTVQTYVPWNLHEPEPDQLDLSELENYLKLAHKLDLLIMLRIGPYVCGEWDFGGFPAWLLAKQPPLRLRTSDASFLELVDKWWDTLLPTVVRFLYSRGGPVIMLQVENEYGSFGDDKLYLQHLVAQARYHLGDDVILYTTDGASKGNLENGSISSSNVYAAVDFATGSDPASAFLLQKLYNAPGKSPPLSAEFYTGWLTHWGERLAKTDAEGTASALADLLGVNGSVVLYMAHGGTNFGFSSGANTGGDSSEFQPDITSYDYDAPIGEAGDVSGEKFQALQKVLAQYHKSALPPSPPLPPRRQYGTVELTMVASIFDVLELLSKPSQGIQNEIPVYMEYLNQASGFILYQSVLPLHTKPGSQISVVEVHDRAQVYISLDETVSARKSDNLVFVGVMERWSMKSLALSSTTGKPGLQIYILVENMGRVNYGEYIFDPKGINCSVLLDEFPILNWRAHPIPLSDITVLSADFLQLQQQKGLHRRIIGNQMNLTTLSDSDFRGPSFFQGTLKIDSADGPADTFLSLRHWTKGVAFINGYNLGRFWPLRGPQCTLYIPAPLLKYGDNELVILELDRPNPDGIVELLDKGDFTCGNHTGTHMPLLSNKRRTPGWMVNNGL
ncbi:hypothetical protein O6H91_07G114700 [Diphasiastrum complanatum]|uniref:Uncharacterized protein n=3 Tax=Diphasiastrum complanatum TaxID=34168 RepID=A0ACC2D8R6_DIPCM|nr:hypothetical protein O6H91_07G114700 [Diphasiastrum complanatum]